MNITIKNDNSTEVTLGGMLHNILHICTKIIDNTFNKAKIGDILYYTCAITPASIINLSNDGTIITDEDFSKVKCRPLTNKESVTFTNLR